MELIFDRGNKQWPKGHALLYYRNSSNPDEVWATYIVLLPITVDVSKYVPPFLMNQVADLGPKDLSAFAFPPAPERMDNYQILVEISERRDDDLLFGGTINPKEITSAMMAINDAVQRYGELYSSLIPEIRKEQDASAELTSGTGVNEVLYELMNDSDKLTELVKLVGRLRFAIDGAETRLIKEAEDDIKVLSMYLPKTLNIPRLIEVIKSSDSRDARLAELYLQRCFYIVQEEYGKLKGVEEQIKSLETEKPG